MRKNIKKKHHKKKTPAHKGKQSNRTKTKICITMDPRLRGYYQHDLRWLPSFRQDAQKRINNRQEKLKFGKFYQTDMHGYH